MEIATETFAIILDRYYDDHMSIRNEATGVVVTNLDDAERLACKIAGAEASMAVYRKMARAFRWMKSKGFDNDAIRLGLMSELVSLATIGADDTWSGRGNDMKRVANDARMRTVSVIQDMIND